MSLEDPSQQGYPACPRGIAKNNRPFFASESAIAAWDCVNGIDRVGVATRIGISKAE
jgi:hypothetical protein